MKGIVFYYITEMLLRVVELIRALKHNNTNDLIFVVIETLIFIAELIAEILQED